MMSKQSIDLPLRDGVLLRGYQKKLKTMKKKYFVLFGETASNCSRLEYFDNEKKFKSGSAPKRIIKLKSCFNINRRLDTKHEFVIALSTKDYGFGIVLESEHEMIKWLGTLITLQRCEDPSCEKPRIHFEHVWQVVVQRKGLAEDKGLIGNHHVCLTSQSLTFIKMGSQKNKELRNIEILLPTIRRCGDSHCFFYMEVGRQSIIGPGELWMETEDSLIAQNMHNMILSAMSTKSDNNTEPMRQRSLSANEASKPYRMLQKNRAKAENNTHVFSHKLGFLNGRERCDSLPTSTNRNLSGCSTLSLTNLAILPFGNTQSSELQKLSLSQRHSNSILPITTNSCSKVEKSSQGSNGRDDNVCLLPYGFHSRSSQGVIPEEKNEEMVNFDKSNGEISESLSNKFKKPIPGHQSCFEDRKTDLLLSEITYLPKQIRSICSDNSKRSSNMSNNIAETYTLMGPICCNVIEPTTYNQEIETFELFPSLWLKNRELGNNFFELTLDNFKSNLKADSDITTKSEGPTRTYSIGNRPDNNNIQMASLSSSSTDASTSRGRAFSVGSKTKISCSDIQRDILNYTSSTKRHSNCSNNNYDLNEVTRNYQLINLSPYYYKKSISAPFLNQRGQNSMDRMSDLMEIDFSKSQKEITTSLARSYHSSGKIAATNHDQLKTQNVLKSNNALKTHINYSSSSKVPDKSGYLEMKPVSSYLDLIPSEIKNELSVYRFKVSENLNDSGSLFCGIKDDDIFKTLSSAKDTTYFENNEKIGSINYYINDIDNIIEYKHEILESLTNDHNDFKNKKLNKTIKNYTEVMKAYPTKNTEREPLKNCQLFRLIDPSSIEQSNENIFHTKSTNACTEDRYILTKQSEVSRNISRIFFKYNICENESEYESLHLKSESFLQPKIIYELPKSGEFDLNVTPEDVTRTNSMKNCYLPFLTSSPKSYGSSTTISTESNKSSSSVFRPLSMDNSVHCFELNNNNIKSEQQSIDVSRPQSVNSDIELCYASLDLPQYEFDTNYAVRSTNKNLTLRSGSPSIFSYAKINFDYRD